MRVIPRAGEGEAIAIAAEALVAAVTPPAPAVAAAVAAAPGALPRATPHADGRPAASAPDSNPAFRLFGTSAAAPAPLAADTAPSAPPVRLAWPEELCSVAPAPRPAAPLRVAEPAVRVERPPAGTPSACAPGAPRRRCLLEAWRTDLWLGQTEDGSDEGLRLGAQGPLRSRAALSWVMLAHEPAGVAPSEGTGPLSSRARSRATPRSGSPAARRSAARTGPWARSRRSCSAPRLASASR